MSQDEILMTPDLSGVLNLEGMNLNAEITRVEALNIGNELLREAEVENSKQEARLLLLEVTGADRIGLQLDGIKPVPLDTFHKYLRFVNERAAGVPLDYILGKSKFMSLDFYINREVFIPRHETELLVEEAINYFKKIENPNPCILELGCGSGAISVSLAYYIPGAQIFAVDISDTAIKVSKINAETNGVEDRIFFSMGDMFDAFQDCGRKFDAIISNPPYISKDDPELKKEVEMFEPGIALFAGENGLEFYHKISDESGNFLKKNGMIFLEIGYNKAADVASYFTCDKGYKILFKKDYENRDRILLAQYLK